MGNIPPTGRNMLPSVSAPTLPSAESPHKRKRRRGRPGAGTACNVRHDQHLGRSPSEGTFLPSPGLRYDGDSPGHPSAGRHRDRSTGSTMAHSPHGEPHTPTSRSFKSGRLDRNADMGVRFGTTASAARAAALAESDSGSGVYSPQRLQRRHHDGDWSGDTRAPHRLPGSPHGGQALRPLPASPQPHVQRQLATSPHSLLAPLALPVSAGSRLSTTADASMEPPLLPRSSVTAPLATSSSMRLSQSNTTRALPAMMRGDTPLSPALPMPHSRASAASPTSNNGQRGGRGKKPKRRVLAKLAPPRTDAGHGFSLEPDSRVSGREPGIHDGSATGAAGAAAQSYEATPGAGGHAKEGRRTSACSNGGYSDSFDDFHSVDGSDAIQRVRSVSDVSTHDTGEVQVVAPPSSSATAPNRNSMPPAHPEPNDELATNQATSGGQCGSDTAGDENASSQHQGNPTAGAHDNGTGEAKACDQVAVPLTPAAPASIGSEAVVPDPATVVPDPAAVVPDPAADVPDVAAVESTAASAPSEATTSTQLQDDECHGDLEAKVDHSSREAGVAGTPAPFPQSRLAKAQKAVEEESARRAAQRYEQRNRVAQSTRPSVSLCVVSHCSASD